MSEIRHRDMDRSTYGATIVGLASIALFCGLITLQGKVTGIAYWLAVIGSFYFAFHTAILDAIVWAALFRR